MSVCSPSSASGSTEAQMCKGDLTVMVLATINILLIILFAGYITYIAFFYEPSYVFSAHPFCMTVGFFCFTTNAIFCVNQNNILLWKVNCGTRYKLYWIMQAIAFLLMTIGFALAVICMSYDETRGHFTTLHGVVGLLLYIQMTIRCIVVILGGIGGDSTACCSSDNYRTLNTVLAITTYAHGMVCLMLGILTVWFRRLNSDYTVAVCIAVLVFLSLCAIIKPIMRLRNRVAPTCLPGCPG